MNYQIKFVYRGQEATAQGSTELEAIQRLLADNLVMRSVVNKFDIAMIVCRIIEGVPHVQHATLYGKYLSLSDK